MRNQSTGGAPAGAPPGPGKLLQRMEWTASPASSETDPELFCPGCDATCDALDRHDWTFGGECPHCGSECDEDQNPGIAYGPEGSCPRRHADGCPLAAALAGESGGVVLVEVSGGVVQDVYAEGVRVIVADHDNIEAGDEVPDDDDFFPLSGDALTRLAEIRDEYADREHNGGEPRDADPEEGEEGDEDDPSTLAQRLHESPDYPRPCLTMHALLTDAVDAWPQFDGDDEVSGGGLVEWFGPWRARVKDALRGQG